VAASSIHGVSRYDLYVLGHLYLAPKAGVMERKCQKFQSSLIVDDDEYLCDKG